MLGFRVSESRLLFLDGYTMEYELLDGRVGV